VFSEPKTDYTYANSKSYRTGTPKDKCVSPNLARPSRYSPGVVGQSQYENGSERAMLACGECFSFDWYGIVYGLR
jgi:hypothetical protein